MQQSWYDTALDSRKPPRLESGRYVLAARRELPTVPSSNDVATKGNPPAIAGSYVVTNELLLQSHAFNPIQSDFLLVFSPITIMLLVSGVSCYV